MSASRRLFFALWPSTEQQLRWQRRATQMYGGSGVVVDSANIHLTLLFLGNVNQDLDECLVAMAANIHGCRFRLCLNQVGYWRKPRVFWWGPSVLPPALLELVGGLTEGARQCGFEPDSRPYKPHITLARKLNHIPPQSVLESENWDVDSFSLLESISSPSGVRYQKLKTWSLHDQD